MTSSSAEHTPERLPSKSDILELPLFVGLGLDRILVPRSAGQMRHARELLLESTVVGFDTEARPTFLKDEPLRGPDVVQFATAEQACVLQLHLPAHASLAREVLASRSVVKVGFDLRNDQAQLLRRLGVRARPLLDLTVVFQAQGHRSTLGVKTAVALLMQKRFIKSKRVTTSNWSRHELEARQVLYAANDAYAAWRVFNALQVPLQALPVWPEGVAPADRVSLNPQAA